MRYNIFIMSSSQQLTGFPGMLRPFKEYLESANLPSGAEVVFFGLPGTCLPFVELLCYAVRTLPITPVFVPRLDISNAKILINIEGFGFQIGEQARISNPAILVMMGGLSMPVSGIAASDAARIVQEYSDASTIGICFMHMFEKTGWTSEISFDLLIDAQVSVDVIRLPLP